jgi:hypothetical protein
MGQDEKNNALNQQTKKPIQNGAAMLNQISLVFISPEAK